MPPFGRLAALYAERTDVRHPLATSGPPFRTRADLRGSPRCQGTAGPAAGMAAETGSAVDALPVSGRRS
jgi:hypothetical protein